MIMDEKDRLTLIRLQKEKSERFLAQAESMSKMSLWDLAANRYSICRKDISISSMKCVFTSHKKHNISTLIMLSRQTDTL